MGKETEVVTEGKHSILMDFIFSFSIKIGQDSPVFS